MAGEEVDTEPKIVRHREGGGDVEGYLRLMGDLGRRDGRGRCK